MANIRIVGNVVQVISSLKKSDIEMVKKFDPSLLFLNDEKGNPMFGIGIGNGGITEFGIEFSRTLSSGLVYLTLGEIESVGTTADEINETKEGIANKFMAQIHSLERIETNILERINDMRNDFKEFVDSIEVVE